MRVAPTVVCVRAFRTRLRKRNVTAEARAYTLLNNNRKGSAMEGFTPLLSSIGGTLIGLAAVALLLINGRIAGISGIVDGVLHPKQNDTLWRVLFVAGLLTGAALLRWLHPEALEVRIDVPLYMVLIGGFLVGIGTRIGNGCTSGHGVCGVGRLARRSIVASAVFFTTAVVTSYLLRHGLT